MITYKNTKNYDENLLDYIKKSSPTKTMQIIIPKDEQTRLINLFENRNNLNENRIDMIVLKKNSLIGINSKIDSSIFCKLTDFKIYDVYIRKDVSNCIK